MIKLFLADIDGCLAAPYEAYALEGFRVLIDLARRTEDDPAVPQLGVCSGRSYAYVEAVAQALGLRGPALFESGAGRFDLPTARIRWSPRLTPEIETQLRAVRDYFHADVLPGTGLAFDYGKRAQAGVVSTDEGEVAHWAGIVDEHVRAHYPDLAVHPTSVSIDVIPQVLTKRVAMSAVAEQEGLELSELAFMGDTSGDIGALGVVGISFAPKNAQERVKAAVDIVTDGAVLDGTIEAFRWCVRHNEVALAAV